MRFLSFVRVPLVVASVVLVSACTKSTRHFSPPVEQAGDPPEQASGERLFLETRFTDLGVWNVCANPNDPDPQAALKDLLCAANGLDPAATADAGVLPLAIALFKTPSLRDLADAAPCMHTGRFDALEDVLGHDLHGGARAQRRGPQRRPAARRQRARRLRPRAARRLPALAHRGLRAGRAAADGRSFRPRSSGRRSRALSAARRPIGRAARLVHRASGNRGAGGGMRCETFFHTAEHGWSVPAFPPLDDERTLVLVFGAPRYGADPRPIAELRAAYPRACLVGCSTSGEIRGRDVADDTLVVNVTRFEHSRLRTVCATVQSAERSARAGEELARELLRDDLRAVLVLSDGLNVNGSELVRGLNAALPSTVVATGGLAGDGARFEKTWVVGRGGPESRLIAAVGIYGERVRVGHGSRGGWDRFGPERVITKSRGNVLHELDGRPALQLYKQYLGDRAAGLPATALLFPLAVRRDTDDAKILVRTILAIDERAQTMTFAGDVQQGHLAQLMRANFERLIDGAADAALQTRSAAGGASAAGDVLAIAISCVGRRLILGERTEEELEAALDALPERTQQVGFYSYGEISPYASGTCDLHNQTMTLTTISET